MIIGIIGLRAGIGQRVVREAVGRGHQVIGFSRNPAAAKAMRTDIAWKAVDVLDADSVRGLELIRFSSKPYQSARWRGYIRFISHLQASDPKTLRDALANRWNSGYVECFNCLKRMLPQPALIIEQRLSMLSIYANAVLPVHEAALESRNTSSNRLWGQPFTYPTCWRLLSRALLRRRRWRSCRSRRGALS
jgi:hypothetical protein